MTLEVISWDEGFERDNNWAGESTRFGGTEHSGEASADVER